MRCLPFPEGAWVIDWRDEAQGYRLLVSGFDSADSARFVVTTWHPYFDAPEMPGGIDWAEVDSRGVETLIDGVSDAGGTLHFDVHAREAKSPGDALRIGQALARVYDAVRALMWMPRSVSA